MALIFYLLGIAGTGEEFGSHSRVCLLSAVVSFPLTAVSGIVSWRRWRRDAPPGVFQAKMLGSLLLLITGIATLGPELAQKANRPSYGVGLFICLWLVGVLAHLGGNIVFRGLGAREGAIRK